MQREYVLNVVVGLSVVAMVAAVGHRLNAQEVEKEIHRIVVGASGNVITHDVQGTAGVRVDDDEFPLEQRIELTVAASPYWIGAECTPVDETLRSQLSLDKGRGLVVHDVVAESPAAKAGLKKYDVIVTVSEQPVGKAADLVKAVEAAKEGELKLSFLRAGKSETITVKPEKRKDVDQKFMIYEHSPLNVRMVRPGMVLPKGQKFNIKIQPFRADLPADMTVTITKTGKTPAKIAIKQGEKSWETTADCLEDLPDDVRKQIEPMMMALPFPRGDRDVITWVPNVEELHERAHEAAQRLKRAPDQIRARVSEAGEIARKKAHLLLQQAESLRESAAAASEEKAKELHESAEKLRREAAEAIEESGVVERGRNFVFKRLDDVEKERSPDGSLKQLQDLLERRFNELQKEIDSLRKNVEELKSDSKKSEG